MSSNRVAKPCDAFIQRDEEGVGPLRLPEKNPIGFVQHFNRIYGRLGLKLRVSSTVPPPDDVLPKSS